jgi:hypothetical protein
VNTVIRAAAAQNSVRQLEFSTTAAEMGRLRAAPIRMDELIRAIEGPRRSGVSSVDVTCSTAILPDHSNAVLTGIEDGVMWSMGLAFVGSGLKSRRPRRVH